MSNSVVIKCFRTKAAKYVYDRHTNSLITVSDNEYDEFRKVEKGELSPTESTLLKHFQSLGMFKPNTITTLKHPETDYLSHMVNHRMWQLILQVTQQCNLRCAYCVYSGIYTDNRQHQSKYMSFETAQKAIDFYLQHSDESETLNVAFYGGEPLLRFDLIKQCISYLEERVNGHNICYNMTTNGTLLTDEVGDYLVEHNFSLAISLDGPKEEHNANRKFRSGEGSFDTIMTNVRRFKERHPEAAKRLTFMTVINPKAELTHVMEYFNTDELMRDSQINFSEMSEVGLSEQISYHESFLLLRRYEYLKLLASLIGKVNRDSVSRLMQYSEASIRLLGSKLNMHRELPKSIQHGGPCLAGIRRLFVTVDGDFLPCERVNETSEFCKIGSVDTGFDIEKISNFINIGNITEEHCKNCWNLLFCLLCYGEITTSDKDILTENDILQQCQFQQTNALGNLYEYAVLSEFGYDANEKGVVQPS